MSISGALLISLLLLFVALFFVIAFVRVAPLVVGNAYTAELKHSVASAASPCLWKSIQF